MEYVDREISVLNESTKRVSSDLADGDTKKSAKKRRSSLATTRRSITGSIVPNDIGVSSASPTSSQSSNECQLNGQPETAEGLKPNPANVHMDEIIAKFHTKIKALDQEYAHWKEALTYWDDQEKHTKLLSESATPILDQDIPDEIKSISNNEFITCPLMDFSGMEKKVEHNLLQLYFNMDSCMKDLHLFRETVRGIKCSNELMKNLMSSCAAEFDEMEFRDSAIDDLSEGKSDIKSDIQNLINSE